jgi:hypothetical protein
MATGPMSDARYRHPSPVKIGVGMICLLLGSIFLIRWLWWSLVVPIPIHDWEERKTTIVSPSHPEVVLTKVMPWSIEGRVVQSVPISDPLLPTFGEFPRSIISPIDLFIVYGAMTQERYFRRIGPGHEFRTAAFRYLGSWDEDLSQIHSWLGRGESALGGHVHEHTVPANYLIFKQLRALKQGDWIKVDGYLVDIKDRHNTYRTSTTKNDIDCEFFYVTNVERSSAPIPH